MAATPGTQFAQPPTIGQPAFVPPGTAPPVVPPQVAAPGGVVYYSQAAGGAGTVMLVS